jgi:phosphoribosyl-ATP pyrophosphohydrolase
MSQFSLHDLEAIIAERAKAMPEESWTASLLANRTALTAEAADALFHLLVLLKSRGISLDAVMEELQRRTAQSGIEEKATRT